jgi:outer membrane protein assembly factor BamB
VTTIQKPPRWWPLLVICGLEAICLISVWTGPAIQRQERVLKTAVTMLLALLLSLVWLLALSRLRWRVRVTAASLFIAALVLASTLFRFQGVSGDLVPIFAPRWRSAQPPAASSASRDAPLPEFFVGFPQFLGPLRNGVVPGPPLARDWQARRPELLWRVTVGEGYGGFAIGGPRAICLEQRAANEAIVCRDLFTGVTLWAHEYPARYENSLGGIGPRTTPAIDGGRVFALGATGRLHCLDLVTGGVLWEHDILSDAKTKAPDWGVAGSPLVVNDLVIVHPGGADHSLAAYRAKTGDVAWAAGHARAGYSSPQRVTLLNEPQFLIFNHDGVAGHAANDGHVLWRYPWTNAAQHVTDPRVVATNRFVVSSGYGAGADLVELSRDAEGAWKSARVWHSQRLKSKFASLIAPNGFLYGLDDGRLACLALESGEPRWKGDRIGHGQLLLSGDLLIATTEDGDVLLLEPRPDTARELGRFAALQGKMWNPPALAPPFLIVRTEREAACYRLPLANEVR